MDGDKTLMLPVSSSNPSNPMRRIYPQELPSGHSTGLLSKHALSSIL